MSDLCYLAGPYSNGTAEARLARFHALTHIAARLIEKQLKVFSPITMTHPIDLVLAADGETLGSDFWVAFDEAFMDACSRLLVVKLPGWDTSRGVAREIAYFGKRHVRPEFIEPTECGVSAENALFSCAFVT